MPRPPLSLRGRALGYLARREHSRAELKAKLRRHALPDDDLDALLDDFERRGWLSEKRLVEQVVSGRHRFGAARLLHDLRRRGVDEKLIGDAAGPLRRAELATAKAVWQKKFGELPTDPLARLKQMRFLHNRGFSSATIERILRGRTDDDEG
jgi:regulatory protein